MRIPTQLMVQHGASPTTGTRAAHTPQAMEMRDEDAAHAASHQQHTDGDDAEPSGGSAQSLGKVLQ